MTKKVLKAATVLMTCSMVVSSIAPTSSFTFVRTLIKCIISSFYMCFVIDYPHNPLRP